MKSKKINLLGESNVLAFAQPLVTVSATLTQGTGEEVQGRKIVKAGTVIPSNDSKAIGILLSDADTTNGDVEVAVAIEGYFYKDKLPKPIASEAQAVLKEIKTI